MSIMRQEYHFQTSSGEDLIVITTDPVRAFYSIKRLDQENFQKLKKYTGARLPPPGYSLLDVGFGFCLAFKSVVPDLQESETRN